jgi:hypothetical protein
MQQTLLTSIEVKKIRIYQQEELKIKNLHIRRLSNGNTHQSLHSLLHTKNIPLILLIK